MSLSDLVELNAPVSILNKVGTVSNTLRLILVVVVGLNGVVGWADESASHLMSSKPAVIMARPKFGRHGPFIRLIVSDTNGTYVVPWSRDGETSFTRASLDTNRVYAFTVDDEFAGHVASGRLLRIEAEGRTLYDAAICEVHKVNMELKDFPIAYGRVWPRPDEPSPEWKHWSFPHAPEYVYVGAGCIVEPDRPKTRKAYFCNQCMTAYEKWQKDKASGSYPELAVKSISDTRPRLALINDQTMAPGEKAKVRLGDGRVTVDCIKIQDGSVTVRVGDEPEHCKLQLQTGMYCISTIESVISSAAEKQRRAAAGLALLNDDVLLGLGETAEITLGEETVFIECTEIHDAGVTVRVIRDDEVRKLPARVIRHPVR